MKRNVLLDLDGTLLDSKPGIIRCVNHALVELGIEARDETELVGMIGPPLHLGFPRFLGTEDRSVIATAVKVYRQRYHDVGIYECELFPGVAEMVAKLRAMGHSLYVVTAKPKPYADRLVRHFDLLSHFQGVYAPTFEDKRDGKAHLIQDLLGSESVDPTSAVMVGDRDRDVLSAKETRVSSIAVLWGYGGYEELAGCEPNHLVTSPAELLDLLSLD